MAQRAVWFSLIRRSKSSIGAVSRFQNPSADPRVVRNGGKHGITGNGFQFAWSRHSISGRLREVDGTEAGKDGGQRTESKHENPTGLDGGVRKGGLLSHCNVEKFVIVHGIFHLRLIAL